MDQTKAEAATLEVIGTTASSGILGDIIQGHMALATIDIAVQLERIANVVDPARAGPEIAERFNKIMTGPKLNTSLERRLLDGIISAARQRVRELQELE